MLKHGNLVIYDSNGRYSRNCEVTVDIDAFNNGIGVYSDDFIVEGKPVVRIILSSDLLPNAKISGIVFYDDNHLVGLVGNVLNRACYNSFDATAFVDFDSYYMIDYEEADERIMKLCQDNLISMSELERLCSVIAPKKRVISDDNRTAYINRKQYYVIYRVLENVYDEAQAIFLDRMKNDGLTYSGKDELLKPFGDIFMKLTKEAEKKYPWDRTESIDFGVWTQLDEEYKEVFK